MFPELQEFIKQNAESTDIYCFQEIYSTTTDKEEYENYRMNLYSELRNLLPDFKGRFEVRSTGYLYLDPVDFDLSYGLAAFVDQQHDVEGFSNEIVCTKIGHDDNDGREVPINVQITRLDGITILNLHGVWIKSAHKIDTPERIEQSKNLKKITERELTAGREVILCGDFNLKPDTESIQILESAGLRNLVREHEVADTRTSFYKKEIRTADYIFVSDGIQVNDFTVLPDEISDHAPLYLDFEIS